MAAVITMMNKRTSGVDRSEPAGLSEARTAEGMLTKTTESKNNRSKAINHLPVKADRKVLLLKVDDIDWVESGHNYVTLRMGRQSYKLRGTLDSIERRLPKTSSCGSAVSTSCRSIASKSLSCFPSVIAK